MLCASCLKSILSRFPCINLYIFASLGAVTQSKQDPEGHNPMDVGIANGLKRKVIDRVLRCTYLEHCKSYIKDIAGIFWADRPTKFDV